MILDGWGHSEPSKYNAIALAHTPQWDHWWATAPHSLIQASGSAVGLPEAQMGNSEVGHMHIGAGRTIPQDLTRINEAIQSKAFKTNPVLWQLIESAKRENHCLHIMGLLSPGGVHSHQEHLFAFLELCHQHQFNQVRLHLFLDGRDTPPHSAKNSLKALDKVLKRNPVGKIASLTGRYFAMDRDQRWDRIQAAYNLLTAGKGAYAFASVEEALDQFYAQGTSDEFIPPTRIGADSRIEDGDSIFFFNFRSDRTRQLTTAFLDPTFNGFARTDYPKLSNFVSLTDYGTHLKQILPAFPPIRLENSFGEILAEKGFTQLRLAETEKYAHVTFFFNGGTEDVFPGEERILIPSPNVATYDLCPQMSAEKLTDALVEGILSGKQDVIICNYANADMVGHSGNLTATIQAIECLDQCLIRIGKAIEKAQGTLVITADHGNADCMFDPVVEQTHTAHTSSPVPFLLVDHRHPSRWEVTKKKGSLVDISPTLLMLLDIKKPEEMTGHSLVVEKQCG